MSRFVRTMYASSLGRALSQTGYGDLGVEGLKGFPGFTLSQLGQGRRGLI